MGLEYSKHIANDEKGKKRKCLRTISLKTDGDLVDELNRYCIDNNMSVAGFLIDLIIDFLNGNLEIKENPTYSKYEHLKGLHYANKSRVKFKGKT